MKLLDFPEILTLEGSNLDRPRLSIDRLTRIVHMNNQNYASVSFWIYNSDWLKRSQSPSDRPKESYDFRGTFNITLDLEKPAKQQSGHNPFRFVILSIFLILNQVSNVTNSTERDQLTNWPTEPPKLDFRFNLKSLVSSILLNPPESYFKNTVIWKYEYLD